MVFLAVKLNLIAQVPLNLVPNHSFELGTHPETCFLRVISWDCKLGKRLHRLRW